MSGRTPPGPPNNNNPQQRPQLGSGGIPHAVTQSTVSRPFAGASAASVPNPLGSTSTSTTISRPRVPLTPEAKAVLSRAIWAALKQGTIDESILQEAEAKGIPRQAVFNATNMAREREAQKRRQQAQQGVTTAAPPRAVPHQAPVPMQAQPPQTYQSQPPVQQQQQTPEMRQKLKERAHWKRTQHGIFLQSSHRFVAAPYSVGAMVRSTNTLTATPSWPRSRAPAPLWAQAKQIQARLVQQRNQQNAQRRPIDWVPYKVESYKRTRLEAKKVANGLARVNRKAKTSQAEGMVKKHKDLFKQLSQHQQEFFKFHRTRKADASKLARTIRDSFDKESKRHEKDVLQQERARMAALRANDMTAYSQLLEETKNERLKFLLDKTEQQFSQITRLLQERSDGGSSASAGSSYYATAHRTVEEVRQPTILAGGDLKEYQLMGLQWLVSLYNNNLNGILADEMGLGKTIQAISLVAYLMEFKNNLGPFLVIVPLSTLSNWQNEFGKWCPSARTVCYKGTPPQRKEIFRDHIEAGHFNVLLTTYEYIIKDKKSLRRIDWEYAIVDEGHRMKNAASKFAVTLATQYATKYRILLTGTPLMNDLSELWSLLNFLLPSVFNSVETFEEWFSRPFEQFGSGDANDGSTDLLLSNEERILIIHRLHELLRPFMLRRVKSEVLDQLPEKVEKVLRCDLSSWQKELYKQISAKAVADNSGQQIPSRGLNNVVMQLRKVCNHPYLFSPQGYRFDENMVRSSGKFALLDQMLPKLKAAGHRILMFTQMTQVMTVLEDYFNLRGYLSLRLDGSTAAEEREKRMYKFNAPDSPYFIFLLSTRAGGLGLNLTSASTVIIFDSDWNPMMDLQAQDRAHRIGQRSNVSVFRLVTNSPVEEKILSRATEKLNVSELVVESGQFNKQSVESDNSLERKRMMEVLLTDFDTTTNQPTTSTRPLSEKSGSELGDLGEDDDDDGDNGGDEDDKEDLNELLSNTEADYQLYTSMNPPGGPRAPLFTDTAGIPDWIKNPQTQRPDSAFSANSLDGPRKRDRVVYDDGLTEGQFLRMMDKKIIAEETARKKAKTENAHKLSMAEEARERVAQEKSANTSTELTDWTFRKLISCAKTVANLKDPNTKRRLADIFLEKPDPGTFPDYYEIIEKPIAINDIMRKCRNKMYSNLQEFKEDWSLMFANAFKFNGEDSWVSEDAKALDKELERVLKKNGFTDTIVPTSKKTIPKPAPKPKPRIKISLKRKADNNA